MKMAYRLYGIKRREIVKASELYGRFGEDGAKQFNYRCVCCEKGAHSAALDSHGQEPHFRHDDAQEECPYSKGTWIVPSDVIRKISERGVRNSKAIEFYLEDDGFGGNQFSLGFRFPESEISRYERQDASLTIITDNGAVVYSDKVTSQNFTLANYIPLESFSLHYKLSDSLDDNKGKGEVPYEFFRDKDSPIFFKVQKQGKAKLVRSRILYTNTKYIMVALSKIGNNVLRELKINKSQEPKFTTMNRDFFKYDVEFTNEDCTSVSIKEHLECWGYKLEESLAATLLWPPAKTVDGVDIVNSKRIFIHSDFTFVDDKNITGAVEQISRANDVSEICFVAEEDGDADICITEKNIDWAIKHQKEIMVPTQEEIQRPSTEDEPDYTVPKDVPDNVRYYFFDSSCGVSEMSRNNKKNLFPGDKIIKYEDRFPVAYIYPLPIPELEELSGEELLRDILAHCKRTKVFNSLIYDNARSKIVSRYIKECKKTQIINAVVVSKIMKGAI